MRSHSLRPTAPVNTRRSVPRLMPLNSERTVASPGRGLGKGARRNSAAPFLGYQSARAMRVLPVERRVIILAPAAGVTSFR